MIRIVIILLLTNSAWQATAQNVGIGTTTPNARLDIKAGLNQLNILNIQRAQGKPIAQIEASGRFRLGDIDSTGDEGQYNFNFSKSKLILESDYKQQDLLGELNAPFYQKTEATSPVSAGTVIGSWHELSGNPDFGITHHATNNVSGQLGIAYYGVAERKGYAFIGAADSGVAALFHSINSYPLITGQGKVGFGTYNPTNRLQIHNRSNTTPATYAQFTNHLTDSLENDGLLVGVNENGDAELGMQENKSILFNVNNITKMILAPSGQLSIGQIGGNGGSIEVLSDNASAGTFLSTLANGPYLKLGNGTNNNFGHVGNFIPGNANSMDVGTASGNTTGDVNLTIAGTAKLTVKPSGNVGVGTTTPTQKLDVQGNINVSGNIINEAWIPPSLNTGWTNLDGANFATIGYYKDKQEVVHLRGVINYNAALPGIGTVIFTLPPGYRSSTSKTMVFPVSNNNAGIGRVNIDASGNVTLVAGTTPGWISLCGITFRAD
jgi:hypothetical protein